MKDLFIETQSKYSFDRTIEKLSETILKTGWNISVIIDLQGSLSKSGIDILPVKSIELCNPKLASQLLLKSELRVYSCMLPCKISIYEKENGKTYLSLLNIELISSQIDEDAKNVMNEAFSNINRLILDVAEQ